MTSTHAYPEKVIQYKNKGQVKEWEINSFLQLTTL